MDVTDEDITVLMAVAAEHGDSELVELCRRALGGIDSARHQPSQIIRYARIPALHNALLTRLS